MTTYKDLLKQREALEQQINEARAKEIDSAVAKIKATIADYGLTPDDIFPSGKKSKNPTASKVAPKYKNPATNETWTGRGKPPAWIKDQDRAQFEI